MNSKKKERFAKMAYILNGVVFLLGGIAITGDGKILFGVIQILAGLVNLLVVRIKNDRSKYLMNYVILSFNMVVAIIIAVDYIEAGKDYIQYAWFFVALTSFITGVIHYKKFRKERLSKYNP